MAFKYKDYEESDEVERLRKVSQNNINYNPSSKVQQARTNFYNHEKTSAPEWNGGTYGEALKGAINNLQNREKFKYDLNADALYQQYKDQYMNQGRIAMQDTIGQASALTGGYGNSYANIAGNQAYQSYLQRLNDVVPELYQMAYNRYKDEGDEMKDQYNILANQYQMEYGENRDAVADWNNEANRLADLYYNEANMDFNRFKDRRDAAYDAYNKERSYDYGIYQDAYANAMNAYKQGVAEDEYNRDMAYKYANLAQNQSQHESDLAYKYAALNQDKSQYNQDLAYKYAALSAKDTTGSGKSGSTDLDGLDEEAFDYSMFDKSDWEELMRTGPSVIGLTETLKALDENYERNILNLAEYERLRAIAIASSVGDKGTKTSSAPSQKEYSEQKKKEEAERKAKEEEEKKKTTNSVPKTITKAKAK